MTTAAHRPDASPITVSHIFGELTWLFTRSASHALLPIGELNWQLMPPIARRQFHIFRDGEQPIGAITWARLNEPSEILLSSDRFHPPFVAEGAWSSGDKIWIIEFIAPFASKENRHRELMLADLIAGPMRGVEFRMLYLDPNTNQRIPLVIEAGTAEGLIRHISDVIDHTQSP